MRHLFILLSMVLLSACSNLETYHALPKHLENQAQIVGFPNVRAWGDEPSIALQKSALRALTQEKNTYGHLNSEVNILALSGGGSDGAFGAGILCGWSASGSRPNFKLVTGISTGALIAPFAFLGKDYDDRLKYVYTMVSDKDIYKSNNLFAIFLSFINVRPLPSLADTKPLADIIAQLIDAEVLRKIASEHLKGRRLWVGTTQLNAQRLVIWDMGAIALKNTPESLALFRKILLASASLPGTFPPQYFDVIANGKYYTEMHVDGGVESQVIIFENALVVYNKKHEIFKNNSRVRNLYIIRNLKINPEWEYIKPQLRYIATRSINTLIKTQGIGDIFRLYAYSLRDGFNFKLAYIPEDFKLQPSSSFDKKYMQALFNLGYTLGKTNQSWQNYPPFYNMTNLKT